MVLITLLLNYEIRLDFSIKRQKLAWINSLNHLITVCYMMSSMVIWAVIFYVDGIRDSIDELASTICIYIFDFIMVVYFLAFPAVTYIYHPYVRKRLIFLSIYGQLNKRKYQRKFYLPLLF